MKFGPIEVSVPKDPMAYINRYFGKDAMEGYFFEGIFYEFAEFLPADYIINSEDEYIFELENFDDLKF